MKFTPEQATHIKSSHISRRNKRQAYRCAAIKMLKAIKGN